MKLKAIFFDLDDTLFDTWGQLAKKASEESCASMIEAGLNATVNDCVSFRKETFFKYPRQSVYQKIVEHFGLKQGEATEVAKRGERSFLDRQVETNIRPFPGVYDLLSSLRVKYHLYLVTAGEKNTQAQKVNNLKLAKYFRDVLYVDPRKNEKKQDAFRKVMSENFYLPSDCLSVGNRIDQEIAEAKELGMYTCYVKQGEYVYLSPERNEEIPDFTIDRIRDLLNVCQL